MGTAHGGFSVGPRQWLLRACDEPSHHPPPSQKACPQAFPIVVLSILCYRLARRSHLLPFPTALSIRPACEVVLGGLGGPGGSPKVCGERT
jgi:hypothetical protein